jgi:hypothetical protein
MLIHKIQRNFFNSMYKILNFSKITRENSNFSKYLSCPHHLRMRKSEKKSWEIKLGYNNNEVNNQRDLKCSGRKRQTDMPWLHFKIWFGV